MSVLLMHTNWYFQASDQNSAIATTFNNHYDPNFLKESYRSDDAVSLDSLHTVQKCYRCKQ